MLAVFLLPLALVPAPEVVDAQNLRFRDMPWGAKVTEVKAPLGFTFRDSMRPNSRAWRGMIGKDDTVIVYAFTPVTERLSEVTLIIVKESKFFSAKSRYHHYRKLLTRNYGNPTQSYEFFPISYLATSNGEDLALAEGKYVLSNFWDKFTKTFIGMAITPEGWTCVTFESNEMRQSVAEESRMILR